MTSPSTTFARVFVDELARNGVTDAALSPGSRSAPLAMALHDHPSISVHIVLDERSASFFALGVAKASGRASVVVSTSGTAAANFFPAVVEARHAHVPLIVLTADRPPELRDTGAGQTIDQGKLYGSYPLWFVDAGTPEGADELVPYWRTLACRAVAASAAYPRGPVHINVPLREPLVPDDGTDVPPGRPGGAPWTGHSAGVGGPAAEQIDALASIFAANLRGALVIGDADVDPGSVEAVALAAGWPVFASPLSGARRGTTAISMVDALLRSERFAEGHGFDAVVQVGGGMTSKALIGAIGRAGTLALIDEHGEWLDPSRSASLLVHASPSDLLRECAAQIPGRADGAWLDGWIAAERGARAAIDAALDASDVPSEPRAARDLASHLESGSTLVVGSSMPVRDLDWFMAPREGLRVLGNRGANGIDGFVSTATGIAHASAGPCVALAGDLSLLHDRNGLAIARAGDIDLVIVVINNDGGGIFTFLPQRAFEESFESLFGTPHGYELSALARAEGCGHRSISAAPALGDAIDAAATEGGLQLVEIRTDRDKNAELHRQLWDAVAATVEEV
ncbi:MAG TPA: 2-succinyl-5-enolpyruvyl-6-hydroxy-3-cyclohexene-1-carboxylic-acid synthase [Actinomycetota bacterium]|nr:2-succinyl-5-enolpyruvyl-6-hydroxy-3-cyclohexene-1-carboxylic-acid synthase [Actinomycetota bacterium]